MKMSQIKFDLFSIVPIIDHYFRHWPFGRKVLLLVAPASLPLFIFAFFESEMAFFKPSILVRFLITMPLLLLTSAFATKLINRVIEKVIKTSLLNERDERKFFYWLEMMKRYRQNRILHLFASGLIFSVSIFEFLTPQRLWLLDVDRQNISLTVLWFFFIARPIYWMVLLNYLFCVFIWSIFILRVTFFDLNIRVAHGDGTGGLSIFNKTVTAFNFTSFSLSTAIAAEMSEHILKGVPLEKYYIPLGLYSLIPLTFHVLPLLFFFFTLLKGKRIGIAKYDLAFVLHLDEFTNKRIDPASNDKVALEINDYSSTTDFTSIVERAHAMKLLPISKKVVMQLLFFFYLPFLPVAFLTLPFPVLAKYLELLIKSLL